MVTTGLKSRWWLVIVIIGTVHHFSETAAHRTMKREFLLQVAVAVKEDERHSVCPNFQTDSFFGKVGRFLAKIRALGGRGSNFDFFEKRQN